MHTVFVFLFFLMLIVKNERREVNWGKNCRAEKKWGWMIWKLLNLVGWQKMLKLKKRCSKKKSKSVAEQLFANLSGRLKFQTVSQQKKRLFKEMKGMTHMPLQPSQQKPKLELILEIVMDKPLVQGTEFWCTHERSTKFLRNIYQQKHCHLVMKGEYNIKESCQSPNSIVKKQTDKSIQLQSACHLSWSKNDTEGRVMNPDSGAANQRITPRAWNLIEFPQLILWIAQDWWLFWLSFFFFFPFWARMPLAFMPCLTYHCILGADNFFLQFHESIAGKRIVLQKRPYS